MEIKAMIKQGLWAGLVWLGLVAGASAQTTIVEYIHTDALGSPVATTDAAGNVIERQVYEPYGAPIAHGPTDGPGFTGHVEDSATGLTYMQQRYYDPTLGVFYSVDPVGVISQSQFARFRYAGGNPYKFVDPDGRIVESVNDASRTMTRDESRFNLLREFALKSGNEEKRSSSKSEEPRIPPAGDAFELLENTWERAVRRTSFAAGGGVAFGPGIDLSATKTTRPWQNDKIGAYGVLGVGAYGGAVANFRLFSWGEARGESGFRLKGNPLGYFKLRIGAGLSVGMSGSFNDQGGGAVSVSLGGGVGSQLIVKPPVTLGWEKEL